MVLNTKYQKDDAPKRLEKWHNYYSKKRIIHHWNQIDLISKYADNQKHILEIGPAFGLVTACLANAGYNITTLDMFKQNFCSPDVGHMENLLQNTPPETLDKFDVILCCETLEHMNMEDSKKVLNNIHKKDRILIISVPYNEWQISFNLSINMHTIISKLSHKAFKFLKTFPKEPEFGHQWEVGYKNTSLKTWEENIVQQGYEILIRNFTFETRSVFHVLRGV